MKAKLILWRVTLIPLSIMTFAIMAMTIILMVWVGLFRVFELAVARYEHWCFDVEPDYFGNTPFDTTFKQVFMEGFQSL